MKSRISRSAWGWTTALSADLVTWVGAAAGLAAGSAFDLAPIAPVKSGLGGAPLLTPSCRGVIGVSYPGAPVSSNIGDIVRVEIKLGAGTIRGGSHLVVNRLRFDLDCQSTNLGIDCADDGPVLSYQERLTSDCGVAFTASVGKDSLFPNQVLFTPEAPLVIPAEHETFCTLAFDVRIVNASRDATPDVIEEVAGYDPVLGDAVCDTSPPLASSRANTGQICIGPDCETANTSCDPLVDLGFPGTPRLQGVGTTLRAHLSIGAGETARSVPITINRVRMNLDCNSSHLALNCLDDGPVVSYMGRLSTSCPTTWSADHAPGDVLPNQIVFTPDSPMDVPANSPDYCALDFDVRLESRSSDETPDVIEETVGIDPTLEDAFCSGRPHRAGGDLNNAGLELCPVCDDGNSCNGQETCDGETGCVPGPPLICDDHDGCTIDSCNPDVPPPDDPCVFTGDTARCNDQDPCTIDACDPQAGCTHRQDPAVCDDADPCTADACDPQVGCIHTTGGCDDADDCTLDTCDPAAGCLHAPRVCDDGNTCTTDACEPVGGCVFVPNGICASDPRGLSYWRGLCRGRRAEFFTAEDVACVSRACPFRTVDSIEALCERLSTAPRGDACAKAEALLLALELNVCRGRLGDDQTVRPACHAAATIGDARAAAEARLCDPLRSASSCRKDACGEP